MFDLDTLIVQATCVAGLKWLDVRCHWFNCAGHMCCRFKVAGCGVPLVWHIGPGLFSHWPAFQGRLYADDLICRVQTRWVRPVRELSRKPRPLAHGIDHLKTHHVQFSVQWAQLSFSNRVLDASTNPRYWPVPESMVHVASTSRLPVSCPMHAETCAMRACVRACVRHKGSWRVRRSVARMTCWGVRQAVADVKAGCSDGGTRHTGHPPMRRAHILRHTDTHAGCRHATHHDHSISYRSGTQQHGVSGHVSSKSTHCSSSALTETPHPPSSAHAVAAVVL